MIAADTSSLIAYLNGEVTADCEMIDDAFADMTLYLPSAVLLELLSDPAGDKALAGMIDKLPLLPIMEGYWQRAALARRMLLSQKLKAKVGDALVAQSCIDHDVVLITRDKDFRHYAKHCGLKLYA